MKRQELVTFQEVIKLNCNGSFQNGMFVPYNGNPELTFEVGEETMMYVIKKGQTTVTADYYGETVNIHQDHLSYV